MSSETISKDGSTTESFSNSDTATENIWKKSVSRLESELDPQIYSAYIQPLIPASYNQSNAEFEVLAPSIFIRNHVDKNFRDKLVSALSSEMGAKNLCIKLIVNPQAAKSSRLPHIVVKKIRKPEFDLTRSCGDSESGEVVSSFPSGLNSRYTFASFIVGKSNEFCNAAAMRVAEQPGKDYNPLFVYGGVGLGKTHLLHAIGNAVLDRNPSARVVYMSSEAFTNHLIHALRNSKMDLFRARMRSVNVLLIDDIQFMSGKEATQEEFFHTFNTLYHSKNQIIITSDKLPHEISGIEERLKTRFSSGLTADIDSPDFETRVAILRRRAANELFSLPDDVAKFIAENISSNVRELEGALTRVHAISSLRNSSITLDLAQSALRPLLQQKVVNVSMDDIKTCVAEQFGIKIVDLTSKRRTRNLAYPRHIAMYLCRKYTSASFPEIGTSFGGRDHSSAIHACQLTASRLTSDQKIKEIIGQIERKLFS